MDEPKIDADAGENEINFSGTHRVVIAAFDTWREAYPEDVVRILQTRFQLGGDNAIMTVYYEFIEHNK